MRGLLHLTRKARAQLAQMMIVAAIGHELGDGGLRQLGCRDRVDEFEHRHFVVQLARCDPAHAQAGDTVFVNDEHSRTLPLRSHAFATRGRSSWK
jgi:hypothetical protein